VHSSDEDKSDDTKDKFQEELECALDSFPTYEDTNLFGDFNAEVGRQNTFRPTIA
jgi:hypothetical protein